MEQTKKRHNPPIFEEDRAVKAFDSDSGSLDGVVERAKLDADKFEPVKTDEVRAKELYNLFVKVFGSDLSGETHMFKEVAFLEDNIDAYKVERPKWYKKRQAQDYVSIQVEVPSEVIKSDAGEVKNKVPFIHEGKYAPIKITAHTPEALNQAKVFAAAYEKISDQKARIIQNCVVEEIKLEGKVDKVSLEDHKNALKNIFSKTGKGSYSFGKFLGKMTLAPWVTPTAVRRYAAADLSDNACTGYFFTFLLMLGGTYYFLKEYDSWHWQVPAAFLGTNLLSGAYEWYRYELGKVREKK